MLKRLSFVIWKNTCGEEARSRGASRERKGQPGQQKVDGGVSNQENKKSQKMIDRSYCVWLCALKNFPSRSSVFWKLSGPIVCAVTGPSLGRVTRVKLQNVSVYKKTWSHPLVNNSRAHDHSLSAITSLFIWTSVGRHLDSSPTHLWLSVSCTHGSVVEWI